MKSKCILFIPVSSTSGIGEYMRSMIIAKALFARFPSSDIHFILNEKASYIDDCPYTVHTSKGSPTKDSNTVNRVISQLRPDIVLFDSSGRANQFKLAKNVGAKVAFISFYNKKRRRGLKINRLLYTDKHWVVQPDYCMKRLSWWQKGKLSFFNKQPPENIGPVFQSSTQKKQLEILIKFKLEGEDFFLFNAGSGGHYISGVLAIDIYYQVAKLFYQKTKVKCVVVFGCNYPKEIPIDQDIICLRSLENAEYITLLSAAIGRVICSGDTVLQCIALHKPSVASSVSPDQPARLKLCSGKGLVLAAEPTVNSLIKQSLLLEDRKNNAYDELLNNMKKEAPLNALTVILDDIVHLIND
ncbi:MAG: glycosyltransferase family 1 protein [Colwellia sp.]|nr:glycosyltransferase family 1 protein [Colwellia sp.]